MRFEVLGAVRVLDPDGTPVPLGPRQHRVVLATLLARPNRYVPVDVLATSLWNGGSADQHPIGDPADQHPIGDSVDQHPIGGWADQRRTAVRVLIHHLRRLLGADAICRSTTGYQLCVPAGRLDSAEFAALVERAATADASGHREEALRALRAGLSLWRGAAAFEDDDYGPLARVEGRRLQELRLAAYEECFELELALGRHREITAELTAVAGEHPLRERLKGQLMLALDRDDRRAEALATFDHTRRLLADRLGLRPGPRLRELQVRILRGDAASVGAPTPAMAVAVAEARPSTMDPSAGGAFAAALLETKERTGRSYRELARSGYVSSAALHRYCQGRLVPAEFTAIERIALRHGVARRDVERLRTLWMRAMLELTEPTASAAGLALPLVGGQPSLPR